MKIANYESCNETCPGDPSEICGGPGAVMHYRMCKKILYYLEINRGYSLFLDE